MSSSHHSLVYIFWGLLFVVGSMIWILIIAIPIAIPDSFVLPLALMVIGLTAIMAALVWHRLTRQ